MNENRTKSKWIEKPQRTKCFFQLNALELFLFNYLKMKMFQHLWFQVLKHRQKASQRKLFFFLSTSLFQFQVFQQNVYWLSRHKTTTIFYWVYFGKLNSSNWKQRVNDEKKERSRVCKINSILFQKKEMISLLVSERNVCCLDIFLSLFVKKLFFFCPKNSFRSFFLLSQFALLFNYFLFVYS